VIFAKKQNFFLSLPLLSLDENKLEPCQRCSSLFSRSTRKGQGEEKKMTTQQQYFHVNNDKEEEKQRKEK